MTLQVGVKVLAKNEVGKYLLLRRSPETYARINGEWDIPGGRIETGSSLLENLDREVKEETGLSLTSTPVLIGAQDILAEERHIIRLTYTASIRGEPTLDPREHIEFQWVSPEELRGLPDLDIHLARLLADKRDMV